MHSNVSSIFVISVSLFYDSNMYCLMCPPHKNVSYVLVVCFVLNNLCRCGDCLHVLLYFVHVLYYLSNTEGTSYRELA